MGERSGEGVREKEDREHRKQGDKKQEETGKGDVEGKLAEE